MFRKILAGGLFSLFTMAVIALAAPAMAAVVHLPGQVTYRERIALPPGAMLRIQLLDQTLSGAPRLDVEAPIGPGQVPLSFNLAFDDAMIVAGHGYGLVATISTAEGGVLFRNFQPYPVAPLAPEGEVLIVTGFVGQKGDPSAPPADPAPADPAILHATWTATRIGDTPVLEQAKPTLQIGADRRAGGASGCNAWFAPAAIGDGTIRLGNVTATLRGCMHDIGAQETAYFAGLAAATGWQVVDDTLTLYDAGGVAVLTFTR